MAATKLTTLIAEAYVRAPRCADALVHATRRYVLPALRQRIPVRRLRGRTAGGSPGSMLVAGSGPNLEYVTRRFFAGLPQVEQLGWTSPLSLARRLDRLEAGDDLVLARIGRPVAALMDQRYIRAPDLVDLWLAVADPDQVLRQASSDRRRRLRALRRTGLTWSISHDPAAFELFYSQFYQPSVRAWFGDLAVVQARTALRRRFRFGGLMWIEADGKAIAGQLFESDGEVLRLLSLGTLHGCKRYRTFGALDAIRLFANEHALATSKAWLNLGGSLPCLKDGGLTSKRSWGGLLRDCRDCHRDLVVRWPAFNRRVARFLEDMPLVIRDGRKLSALTALSSAAPLDAGAAFGRWRQLAPRGLHRFYVVARHGWQATRAGTAPPPHECVWLCAPGPSESILASARKATQRTA